MRDGIGRGCDPDDLDCHNRFDRFDCRLVVVKSSPLLFLVCGGNGERGNVILIFKIVLTDLFATIVLIAFLVLEEREEFPEANKISKTIKTSKLTPAPSAPTLSTHTRNTRNMCSLSSLLYLLPPCVPRLFLVVFLVVGFLLVWRRRR